MVTSDHGSRELPSVKVAIRRHWVILVITVCLGVAVAAGYSTSMARTYTASAVVLINPLAANPLTPEAASGSGAQLTVALETEAEVVTSPSIAEGVSENLGRLVPADHEVLDVDIPSGTQMVRIAFTTDSAEAAAERAQSFAEVYLDYRQERASSHKESTLATLRVETDQVEADLRELLSDASDSDANAFISREIDLYVDRLAALNSRVSIAEAMSTDAGRVLQPARLPEGANEMSTWLMLAVGGLGALLVGVLLALYREWQGDLIRETVESEIAGVPVFATVPPETTGGLLQPGNEAHEAFRQLRAGVVANGRRPHVLAVGSIENNRLGAAAAANLAQGLAESRFSVLLVAADPDDRSIERLFEIEEGAPGLCDVVSADADLGQLLVHRGNLAVLPGGTDPGSVRELYAGPEFRQLIQRAHRIYDYVVLASASAGSADGDAVGSAADSVLLVLTTDRTTRAQVLAARDRASRLGIATMGAVMLSKRRSRRSAGSAEVRHARAAKVGAGNVS